MCLSKWLSSFKDWEKVVLKMKKVEAAIKKRGDNFCLRVRMVNTYLTLCMGYLARFKLILKSVVSLMWKFIHSALSAYANTKTSILTLCYPSLDSNPQLHHPIVFNWTLLTSHPPMRSDYSSPFHWSHAEGCPFCSSKPLCQSCFWSSHSNCLFQYVLYNPHWNQGSVYGWKKSWVCDVQLDTYN